MSNLKRDIEELVKEKQLAHCCAGMGCETASHIDVQPIINLIEAVVDEIIGEDEKEMVLVESEITVAKEHGYRTKIEKSEWFDEKIHARNKLRKEQRDIKSKLIGKE